MRTLRWALLASFMVAVFGVIGCEGQTTSKSSSGVGGQANSPQGGGKIEFKKQGNAGPSGGADN